MIALLAILMACTSKPQKQDYVLIPGGAYLVGDSTYPVNPQRQVELDSFWISTYEVTNAEFAAFVDSTGYQTTAELYHNAMNFYPGLGEFEWVMDTTAYWRFPFGTHNPGIEDKMDHPVTCISFVDALAYCRWKRERLPTLAEWEVACNASEVQHMWEEDSALVHHRANIWKNETHADTPVHDDHLYTSPVGSYKPNDRGLYDMLGNVFEFCADRPEYFRHKQQLAAARGGSWWCSANSCNYFNARDIGRVNRYASFPNHGFRTVRDNAPDY